jgi:acyl dehydratase
MTKRRYLEDLTGGEVNTTPEIAVSEADIVKFALRYDPQPMHTGLDAGLCGSFGGLIASGWHTAALVMRLLVDSHPLGSTSLLGLGVEDLRWPKPVPPATSSKRKPKSFQLCARDRNRTMASCV